MEPGTSRMYAVLLQNSAVSDNNNVAIGCMDGSWYVDWDQLHTMRDILSTQRSNNKTPDAMIQYQIMMIDLLLVARDNGMREISLERANEIALEYGSQMNPVLTTITGMESDIHIQ